MSDKSIDVTGEENPSESTHDLVPTGNHSNDHEPKDRIAAFSGNLLDRSDSLIYAIVGICFFLAALVALGYSFWDFTNGILKQPLAPSDVATAIIQFVSDLLLVLIIMEVLGTVIYYLKAHTTSLRPFLFIGIISATRGILSIGARLSVVGNISQQQFFEAMIELGVNAAVILALGITLKLIGKFLDEKQD